MTDEENKRLLEIVEALKHGGYEVSARDLDRYIENNMQDAPINLARTAANYVKSANKFYCDLGDFEQCAMPVVGVATVVVATDTRGYAYVNEPFFVCQFHLDNDMQAYIQTGRWRVDLLPNIHRFREIEPRHIRLIEV